MLIISAQGAPARLLSIALPGTDLTLKGLLEPLGEHIYTNTSAFIRSPATKLCAECVPGVGVTKVTLRGSKAFKPGHHLQQGSRSAACKRAVNPCLCSLLLVLIEGGKRPVRGQW
jgi:hypothetical protein